MKKNLKFFLAKVFFAVSLCTALQAQSSPLENAILNGDENAVRKFLDQGADVNATNLEHGTSALGFAILNEKENIVRLFLDRGADANAVVEKDGTSALSYAILNSTENIVRLLLDYGADVNAIISKSGVSALADAILCDKENMVRLLLDCGADINAVVDKKNGTTALGCAILNDKENIVRLLLEKGADINAVVDKKNGTTALGCAILDSTENIVRLLLDYGAGVNAIVERAGNPALGFAINNKKKNIAKLLLENGADPNESGDSGNPAIYDAASDGLADYLAMMEPYIHDYAIPRSYDKAYSYRTGEPYPFMKDIPANIKQLCSSNPEKAIDEICKIIRREAKNDFEKAKMAHDYIAMNITYDNDAARRNVAGIVSDEPTQGWKIVLRDGKAVCAGYSSLFKKIMGELNIKCDLITGFVSGVGDNLQTIGGGFIKPTHAWNVVFLEGAWYIVDCTWDGDKNTEGTRNNAYSTEYLFIKPEDIIRDHYPVVKKHQFLQKPLTPEQFAKNLED